MDNRKSYILSDKQLISFLEEKYELYNRDSFIDKDPILIPHSFSKKEDIEISGLFAATLAWGQRITIIRNTKKLMDWMDQDPHHFILHHSKKELARFSKFSHRTFNSVDCLHFIAALKNIYTQHGSILSVFEKTISSSDANTEQGLEHFRKIFFELPHPNRTEKHVSSPHKKSSCKRLNMYLRWMVRKDKAGIDFGLSGKIRSSQLVCPLDVHSGRVARRLGLLKRKQNDWQAALELTENLKRFAPEDPVKYDFALFGLGVYEGF